MRTLERGSAAPHMSPKVGATWWLRVVLSTIVTLPIAWVIGTLIRLSLDVPETDPWEMPAIILAGLIGGVVGGLVGGVRGWWLAGIALVGAAIGVLAFALFQLMGLGLGLGFGATAWVACTIVIVGSTRPVYGKQHTT